MAGASTEAGQAEDRQVVGFRPPGGEEYLARVGPQVPTIALLYDDELIESVPVEPHDQRVRLVARPGSGLVRLPRQESADRERGYL